MALITGVAGTGARVSTNVKPSIDEMLRVLEPYQTPLLQWLYFGKKQSQVVKNKYGKVEHFEKQFVPHQTTVTAAISESSGLSLTASNVTDVTFFNIGDLVLIEGTGELAQVSSGTVGSTPVLTHINGSTSLSALTSAHVGTYLKVIGSRNFEFTATSGRLSMIQKEVNNYNYLNIFTKYVTTSGRDEAGEAWTDGISHDEEVEIQIKQLKLEVERYLMFAPERGYATSGNERVTYGYGFEAFISTNVNTYTGDLQEAAFDSHLKSVFKKGSNRKVHMCGVEQREDIEKFMKERYTLQQQPGQKTMWAEYGVEANTYRTFSGLTTIIWNPVMDGKYENYGFTMDEDNIKLRFMAPDKTGPRKFGMRKIDLGRNRGTETEILMDVGLQVMHESTHGILYKA
jgi:hypothetical protein